MNDLRSPKKKRQTYHKPAAESQTNNTHMQESIPDLTTKQRIKRRILHAVAMREVTVDDSASSKLPKKS